MNENQEKLLITFVLPCYNVENYVQQCLDSIYECDLPENQFEVLCVNDCSTDNTACVLEENQKRYGNLRVITHKYNKGWGGPRNTGIREANGLYLWFVDADDMIDGRSLSGILHKAMAENIDVLCFNYRRVDNVGNELSAPVVFSEMSCQDGCSFAENAFGHCGIIYHMGYVWRFLYRVDYLQSRNLFFPEMVCWEDTVFMPKAILEAERVVAVPDVMYSYRVNPNSISGTFGRTYPAKLIYEFAFAAGSDLLRFSDEVKDEPLQAAFKSMAIKRYFNGFAIHLFRTSKDERIEFYKMLKARH